MEHAVAYMQEIDTIYIIGAILVLMLAIAGFIIRKVIKHFTMPLIFIGILMAIIVYSGVDVHSKFHTYISPDTNTVHLVINGHDFDTNSELNIQLVKGGSKYKVLINGAEIINLNKPMKELVCKTFSKYGVEYEIARAY